MCLLKEEEGYWLNEVRPYLFDTLEELFWNNVAMLPKNI